MGGEFLVCRLSQMDLVSSQTKPQDIRCLTVEMTGGQDNVPSVTQFSEVIEMTNRSCYIACNGR